MAYYYVNANAQQYPEDGEHEIHRGDRDCSHPPHPGNKISLGWCSTCEEAMKKARELYDKVDGCKYCNDECHNI